MKTLLINGSPRAKGGNTELFITQFMKGMKKPCEVRYAAKEEGKQIAAYLQEFDAAIVVMPLYIHAMPGIVMDMITHMEPVISGKSLGYIVQSGFIESAQSKYLERYLCALSKRLNYNYLGTVIKGNAAGTYMMPEKMNKKLFCQLRALGEYFEKNGTFDAEIIKELAKPYELSNTYCRLLQFLYRIGVGNIFWNSMLKKNDAYRNRLDQPFMDMT